MSLEDKQEYLRANIVELNYDPAEFLEYLVSLYGDDATNLDIFTLKEISEIVSKFQSSHKQKIDEDVIVHKESLVCNDFESIENKYASSPNKNQNLDSQNVDNYEFKKIKQPELEQSPISGKEFSVQLSNPEKKEGSLFSKSYVTYTIKTIPFQYEVKRRFSDFEWLRGLLISFFPDLWLPPLPFKSYSERFDNEFIEKRLRYLQKFIDSLIDNPIIANSSILFDFLTVNGEKELNDTKKLYSKVKPPTQINEIKSISNHTIIKFNPELSKEFEKIKFSQNYYENLIEKISVSIRHLNNELNSVGNRMQEISDYFEQLTIVAIKTSDNNVTVDTYKYLKKIMCDWGKTYIKEKDLIDNHVREYFNFIKRDYITLKENIIKIENYKNEYEKYNKKLHERKTDLLKNGNIQKYEVSNDILKSIDIEKLKDNDYAYKIILTKETVINNQLKDTYYYYLNRLIDEFNRVRNFIANKHKTQFMSISENLSEIISNLHLSWADLISYYSDFKDEK